MTHMRKLGAGGIKEDIAPDLVKGKPIATIQKNFVCKKSLNGWERRELNCVHVEADDEIERSAAHLRHDSNLSILQKLSDERNHVRPQRTEPVR